MATEYRCPDCHVWGDCEHQRARMRDLQPTKRQSERLLYYMFGIGKKPRETTNDQ